MKRNKLSEAGIPVADLARKYKIANSTYYKVKAKYAGMSVSDIQRLKALEDENMKLKQMYADISLEHRVLKEVMEKKFPELIDDN